jgi:hypothetical protein
MGGRRTADGLTDQQRRSVRRTAILLAVVAIGIYVAFIASSVMKAQP